MFAHTILYVLVVLVALSALLTVSQVGLERRPVTPGTASLVVLVNALYIAGLVYVGFQL